MNMSLYSKKKRKLKEKRVKRTKNKKEEEATQCDDKNDVKIL